MAKKPDAARGKTTRIGRLKKAVKGIKGILKEKDRLGAKGQGMSPGAMGGRTKMKSPQQPKRGMRPVPASRTTPRRGLTDLMRRTALKGAGLSGSAMAGQAFKLAKKLKPKGRLNVDDIKKAKEMMKNRKGK